MRAAALLLLFACCSLQARGLAEGDPVVYACMQAASARYGVPLDLVRAVARTEGGRVGTVSVNRNGSADLGIMQINSIHLPWLARYGITRTTLIEDPCVNVHIGVWILHRELSRPGDYWTNVGAYNSRTPQHNARYRARVWANLIRIWSGR